jgi:hypothetical protein
VVHVAGRSNGASLLPAPELAAASFPDLPIATAERKRMMENSRTADRGPIRLPSDVRTRPGGGCGEGEEVLASKRRQT